jgi:hypothetical protein
MEASHSALLSRLKQLGLCEERGKAIAARSRLRARLQILPDVNP